MKRFAIVSTVLTLLLLTFFASAQTLSPIEKIVREKIRVSPEVLDQITNGQTPTWIAEEHEREHNSLRTENYRSTDALVSGSADPESEVHAAINPTDTANIVVSANSSNAQTSLTDGLNPIYYTKNFGNTWQLSNFLANPDGGTFVLGGGDPMFAYDKTGKVFMSWINLHADLTGVFWDIFWAWSDDGGETWTKGSQPLAHSEGDLTTFIPDTIYDKQWMVVDRGNSIYENTLYCVFFEAAADNSFGQISLRKKTPLMNNFTSTSVRASDLGFSNMQFCSIDIDDNGGIHVSYFATLDDVNWALYHSLSNDGGATFGSSVKISDVYLQGFSYLPLASDSVVGIQQSRTYPCPHIRVDNSGGTYNGRLYAVWSAEGTTDNENHGLDVFSSYSTDNGQTWSTAQVVNNDNTNNHNFYPSLAVSSQGVVVVTFYDRRSDVNNLNTYYYLAYSFDGGNTFTTQLSVSDAGTDFSTVGSQSGGFGIGEYNQVVTTNTKAIPIWSDARGNDGQLDIYAAIVNIDPNVTSVNQISSLQHNWNVTAPEPNPSDDVINIEANTKENLVLKVTVTDALGKQWMQQDWKINRNDKLQLSVKNLASGIYSLNVSDGKAKSNHKFVKQ